MQGVLLSCRATAWCSAGLLGKSVWSAETCPPHPSQTLASHGLSGGGAHFLPPYPAELSSPETKNVNQVGHRWPGFCQHRKCCAKEAAGFLSVSFNRYYWPERRWMHHADALCWNSAYSDTQPRGHCLQALLFWPTSECEDTAFRLFSNYW